MGDMTPGVRLSYGSCLVALAGVVLISLLSSLVLASQLGRVASAHLLLATGVFPLILGAIGYFTPVLTQTGSPSPWLVAFPALAFLAGCAAIAGLRGSLAWLALAVPLGVLAGGGLLAWTLVRARAGLGDPHPCLRWYQAALMFLVMALVVAGVAALHPVWWTPLRRMHLHLNLVGFVGLTAVGTLHVLIPTVGGFRDPTAASRLHRSLPLVLVGTVLVALGAGWPWLVPAAYFGAACWLVPLGGLAVTALRNGNKLASSLHGAGLSLVVALLGLSLALLAGALGEWVGVSPRGTLSLFFFGFLFPLLTGALAHLLPVWRWPGRPTPARARAAGVLGWVNGLRAVLLLLAGVAGAWELDAWAYPIVGVLLLLFFAQAVVAIGLSGRAAFAEKE